MDTRKINDILNDSADQHMPWRHHGGYLFQSKPVTINADASTIWRIIQDIPHYAIYSNGTITAQIHGELAVGNYLTMELYKHDFIGNFIPPSTERISVVDNEQTTIGWERVLPLGGGTTERYLVLENNTLYGALRIPGCIGFFVDVTLKNEIENAFAQLNNGIKHAAEKNYSSKNNI